MVNRWGNNGNGDRFILFYWASKSLWTVTVACQAPPFMGFSKQGYWNGLPFPSPGDLSNQGIELRSPALQANALPYELPGKSGEFQHKI